jgi:hypothetical protein
MIVDTAFVSSQQKTEMDLPRVSCCIKDFTVSDRQLQSLSMYLKKNELRTVCGIHKYQYQNGEKCAFYIYFVLPPNTTKKAVKMMKQELATALVFSKLAKETELSSDICLSMC